MMDFAHVAGLRVTIMGLGLNGGGLASALYFARRGAEVTVTDLKGAESLAPSLAALEGLSVRLVLGRHEAADFSGADLVIKNPGAPAASPYLAAARAAGVPVETDISVFLSLSPGPILAVTGSKGKSTTASAIHAGLGRVSPRAMLGGNITRSPLDFVDEIGPRDPVVLELSSWQLGDLAGRGLLRPAISAVTRLLPDHLDRYSGMDAYIEDKKAIFREQDAAGRAVFNRDDPLQSAFPAQTRARSYWYSSQPLPAGECGAWLEDGEGRARLAPAGPVRAILGDCRLPGAHNRMNLLCAGLCLSLYGVKAEVVRRALAEFPGIEHRLELFLEGGGIRWYNDSAATMPHAAAAALEAIAGRVVLVAGGADKGLDFAPLAAAARRAAAVVLLAGTATDRLRRQMGEAGVAAEGPFDTIEAAVSKAHELARRARSATPAAEPVSVLLSPGCASFGMFENEFDRGRRFKQAATEIAGQ